MKRISLLFFVLFFGVVSAMAAVSQIARLDGPRHNGTVYRLYDEIPIGGCFPLRVTLENDTNSEQAWRLIATSRFNAGIGSEFKFSKDMSVAAHSSAVYEVMLPVPTIYDIENARNSGIYYGYSRLEVVGALISPSSEQGFSCSSSGGFDYYDAGNSKNPIRLVGYDPGAELYLPKEVFEKGRFKARGSDELGYRLISIDADSMLEDWRAYWGFDMIYLSSKEWGELGILQKQALLSWVRAGGVLVLPGWYWGRGYSIPGLKKWDFVEGNCYYGLGRVQVGEIDEGYRSSVITVENDGAFPLNRENAVALGEYREKGEVNLSGYYIALLCFIVFVGPLNVMWLCRGSRRYRIFITTPLIVAACIALLFLYSLLRDGVGGDGERFRLSVYGGGLNQVLRLQVQGTETGMIFDRSFEVPEKAKLESFLVSGAAGKTMDIRGERYDGDWFRSRSLHSQLIAWSESSREGVSVDRIEAGLVVASSRVKGTLKPFVFKDRVGVYWYAESLSLGEKKTLAKIDDSEATRYLKKITKGGGESLFTSLANRQLKGQSVFFGELINDQSSWVDTLNTIRWDDGTHFAMGSASVAMEEKE